MYFAAAGVQTATRFMLQTTNLSCRQERTPDTLLQGNRGKVRKDLCFDFHSQDGKRIALIIGAVTAECSESHPLVEFHS